MENRQSTQGLASFFFFFFHQNILFFLCRIFSANLKPPSLFFFYFSPAFTDHRWLFSSLLIVNNSQNYFLKTGGEIALRKGGTKEKNSTCTVYCITQNNT